MDRVQAKGKPTDDENASFFHFYYLYTHVHGWHPPRLGIPPFPHLTSSKLCLYTRLILGPASFSCSQALIECW